MALVPSTSTTDFFTKGDQIEQLIDRALSRLGCNQVLLERVGELGLSYSEFVEAQKKFKHIDISEIFASASASEPAISCSPRCKTRTELVHFITTRYRMRQSEAAMGISPAAGPSSTSTARGVARAVEPDNQPAGAEIDSHSAENYEEDSDYGGGEFDEEENLRREDEKWPGDIGEGSEAEDWVIGLLALGANDYRQCGQQSGQEFPFPMPVPLDSTLMPRAIMAGESHAAVWVEGGKVPQLMTFGRRGSLGRPASADDPIPAPVVVPGDLAVEDASLSDFGGVLLCEGGKVFEFGTIRDVVGGKMIYFDLNGVLHLRVDEGEDCPTAVPIDLPIPAVQVASGAHHYLALLANGEVFSWGLGPVGQLGRRIVASEPAIQPDQEEDDAAVKARLLRTLVPRPVNLPEGFACNSVAGCGGRSYFIGEMNGASVVYACGSNKCGELGVGDNPVGCTNARWVEIPERVRVPLPEGSFIRKIVGGSTHTVFVVGDEFGASRVWTV
ncbi:regulator of chromosome condensation 1/beta-lactamase-inhibitor protein II, partial [Blyttiomyces helicus]